MTVAGYTDTPFLGSIRAGADARVRFKVRNKGDDTVRDYTGGSVTATCTPEVGAAFTPTAALDASPSAEPQVLIDIADTQTSGLVTPQILTLAVTVTLSDATKDKPTARLRLIA